MIRNDGPADPVDFEDFVDVNGPGDCTITPSVQSVFRRLARGESATVRFDVEVVCAEPSFHTFHFQDRLVVRTPGVTDPVLQNSAAGLDITVPVFDRSDLSVDSIDVACPARTDIRVAVNCITTTALTNHGAHGPTGADIATAFTVPDDCTATPDDATHDLVLASNESSEVRTVWTLVCERRSFHPVSASSTITVDLIHVEDLVPGNNMASGGDLVEVFEAVDLSVGVLRISCDQRETNGLSSSCTTSVPVTNAGPADHVRTLVTLDLVPGAGCSRTPGAVPTQLVMNTGTTSTVSQTWVVACPTTARHALVGTAIVRADEPHSEDLFAVNDRTRMTWVPQDAKPRSLPSSVNIGKAGVLPFALLSTPELDTLAAVDRTTLTAGRTGVEAVATCARQGEDVNGDGLADLVCRIATTLSGLDCSSDQLVILGRLTDGSLFESHDTINVVPCHG